MELLKYMKRIANEVYNYEMVVLLRYFKLPDLFKNFATLALLFSSENRIIYIS